MYRTALKIAEPGDPQRVTRLSKWAVQHGNNPDPNYEEAINFHQQAVEEATRIGEPLNLAWSTGRLAMSHIWFGHWAEGIEQATRAAAFSEETDDLECQVHCYTWSTGALLTVGDRELATAYAEKAVKAADRTRHQLRLAQAHRMQAMVDFHSGRLRQAADHARVAVETNHSAAPLANLVMISANLGLIDDIEPIVEAMLERSREPGLVYDSDLDVGATLAKLAIDTGVKVVNLSEIKRMLIPGLNASNIPFISMPWWIGRGFFGILTDDRDLVKEVYEHELPNAGIIAPTVSAFSASNDRSLGKFAEFLGEHENAVLHYEDALNFLRPDDYKFELAWTCHDYSRLLVERNEFARAAELIDEGLAIANECELVLLGGKLDSLRATVTEAQSEALPFGLTRRELDVLELLSIGLANREIAEKLFVTENTVRSHAQSIYSKTGLSGRAAAARFAIEHGLAPESV
jgi:ATP/maltotriose-dependent transcriptional regulator MalT